MIRISIKAAAFEAIAATLPLGSGGFETEGDTKGERAVWLEAAVVDRLTAVRARDEGYSDVILWLSNRRRGRGVWPRRVTSAIEL